MQELKKSYVQLLITCGYAVHVNGLECMTNSVVKFIPIQRPGGGGRILPARTLDVNNFFIKQA